MAPDTLWQMLFVAIHLPKKKALLLLLSVPLVGTTLPLPINQSHISSSLHAQPAMCEAVSSAQPQQHQPMVGATTMWAYHQETFKKKDHDRLFLPYLY